MGEPRYREYPIRPALASFIKCIWSLESGGPVYDALPERILPVFICNIAEPCSGESAIME